MNDAPNLVLITVDSLRADYCGFMRENGSHTPIMDRMADNGLVFENAIAPGPATLDSMPVIFSGEYYPKPDPNWSAIGDPDVIRGHMQSRETIPERLADRGYETAAFTTNPWTSRQYGFDDGFDHFEDFMDVDTKTDGPVGRFLETVATDDDGTPRIEPLKLVLDWHRQTDMFQSWDTFYDDIVEWTENATEPYFLWIFLVDTHMPFLPIDEFRSQSRLATYASNLWLYLDDRRFESILGERLRTAYTDTVEYVDDRIGRLADDLSDHDPVFVLHGDHGEEFGEYGDYGHGQRLSEELIHVPLLVTNGPRGRIERPFSLVDLPELLERLADDREIDELPRPVVKSRNFDPKIAVRGADWKYVLDVDGEHLFDPSTGRTLTDETGLLALGRDVATRWQNDETERQEILRSVHELVENEPI